MAVSHIESATTATANPSGTAFTITIPASVQAGDILALDISEAQGTSDPSVTDNDSGGESWVEKAEVAHSAGGIAWLRLYTKRATSGTASKTITIDSIVASTSGATAVLSVYRGGLPTGDPIEAFTTGNGANPASFTASDGAMVCCSGASSNSAVNIGAHSCTSPGALVERIEKQSNQLGTDATVNHCSAVKSGTGATGSFTRGTNAVIAIAYSIGPGPTNYTGTLATTNVDDAGSIDAKIQATGTMIRTNASDVMNASDLKGPPLRLVQSNHRLH